MVSWTRRGNGFGEADAASRQRGPKSRAAIPGPVKRGNAMQESTAPIVVDLGAVSRKRIRELKRGTGKLKDEVQEVVTQIRSQLGAEADGKELPPIVVVYTRKKKRPRSIIDLAL
jgi:hypothetical protein